jgi:hypothetical protein
MKTALESIHALYPNKAPFPSRALAHARIHTCTHITRMHACMRMCRVHTHAHIYTSHVTRVRALISCARARVRVPRRYIYCSVANEVRGRLRMRMHLKAA